MANEKTLIFKIIREKTYELVFTGVTFVNTLLGNWGITIGIIFSSSALVNIIHSVSSNGGISYVMKLTSNFTHALSSGIINVAYSIKETLKSSMANSASASIVFSFTETMRIFLAIGSSSVSFVLSPILATFHLLSESDAGALSAMDSETLQDLDYTSV